MHVYHGIRAVQSIQMNPVHGLKIQIIGNRRGSILLIEQIMDFPAQCIRIGIGIEHNI